MAGLPVAPAAPTAAHHRPRPAITEPAWVRRLLIGLALSFLALLLLLPLGVVFHAAFRHGLEAYWAALTDPYTVAALRLTLVTVALAVPANTLFGLAAAWAITRYEFKGKRVLVSIIDLPFAVSPVIGGLVFVLLFGGDSPLGAFFADHDIKVLFAVPGIVLATAFVTFPFVARELIPVMQRLGSDQELAALTLGASGWQIFRWVTLPNIKWGLLYGVILATARAAGEFGAVSVVSGHIRGETNTLPLHVEVLYNEYRFTDAFAVATLLALVAALTLVVRAVLERRAHATPTPPSAPRG